MLYREATQRNYLEKAWNSRNSGHYLKGKICGNPDVWFYLILYMYYFVIYSDMIFENSFKISYKFTNRTKHKLSLNRKSKNFILKFTILLVQIYSRFNHIDWTTYFLFYIRISKIYRPKNLLQIICYKAKIQKKENRKYFMKFEQRF